VNLHKPFLPIILQAGLTPWPKLIQNLRASGETEWLDSGTPAHMVANWIRHGVKVQNDNYAQVNDHHFEKFNLKEVEKWPPSEPPSEQKKTTRPIKKHGQKTVLSALERGNTGPKKQVVSEDRAEGWRTFGALADDSSRVTHFCNLLSGAGFTAEQKRAIDHAMVGAGLSLVATGRGSQQK